MARYGPGDVAITYSAQALDDVTMMSDMSHEMITEEITAFGQDDETHAPVGVRRMGPITLEAPYTDDSNDLADKLSDVGLGGTATLLIGWGGTKTTSVSTILQSIQRVASRGVLTKVRGVLQPTGAVTEV